MHIMLNHKHFKRITYVYSVKKTKHQLTEISKHFRKNTKSLIQLLVVPISWVLPNITPWGISLLPDVFPLFLPDQGISFPLRNLPPSWGISLHDVSILWCRAGLATVKVIYGLSASLKPGTMCHEFFRQYLHPSLIDFTAYDLHFRII